MSFPWVMLTRSTGGLSRTLPVIERSIIGLGQGPLMADYVGGERCPGVYALTAEP